LAADADVLGKHVFGADAPAALDEAAQNHDVAFGHGRCSNRSADGAPEARPLLRCCEQLDARLVLEVREIIVFELDAGRQKQPLRPQFDRILDEVADDVESVLRRIKEDAPDLSFYALVMAIAQSSHDVLV